MKNAETIVLRDEYKRCVALFTSGILQNSNSIFTQSVFIEMMIRLNDVLQALEKSGERIGFKEDISGKDVTDITYLVNKLRNAACHERTTGETKIGNITFVFNRIVGRVPNAIQIGKDIKIGSEYNDDIAFFYGDKKIYLIRHIQRLLTEINQKLY